MSTATKQKIERIEIHGKRWFQKTYGNTYFTAKIFVNDELVYEMPMQYGYGDHYIDMATQWLSDNGYIERDDGEHGFHQPIWRIAQRDGFVYKYYVQDVARQKDL
jgi:hypothetical protein